MFKGVALTKVGSSDGLESMVYYATARGKELVNIEECNLIARDGGYARF